MWTRSSGRTSEPSAHAAPLSRGGSRTVRRAGLRATSLQEVADRAGVAVQTVYFVFRNKRTLFRDVVDTSIAGTPSRSPPWIVRCRVRRAHRSRAIASARPRHPRSWAGSPRSCR
ncbi:helix-turn-helix domain-containing protein [Micromonospora sp. NPDC047074]|uniref:helix-turn-helix domain-containing protein n=1 Tax=Micromonospora sp. NPDC047074 TaxID=3154339 RepID=UPI0033F2E48D